MTPLRRRLNPPVEQEYVGHSFITIRFFGAAVCMKSTVNRTLQFKLNVGSVAVARVRQLVLDSRTWRGTIE